MSRVGWTLAGKASHKLSSAKNRNKQDAGGVKPVCTVGQD